VPSQSEKQRKYIFYLRSKDDDKSKWFWDKDWESIEEDHIERYEPFDFGDEDQPDKVDSANDYMIYKWGYDGYICRYTKYNS